MIPGQIHVNSWQKPLDSSSKKVDQARLNAHSKALALGFEDGYHHENKIGMQGLKSVACHQGALQAHSNTPQLCA